MGQKIPPERVVLDTNVVVSALLFAGPSNRLVPIWQGGSIRMLASADMIREYARVLAYPKFKLAAGDIRSILHEELLPFVTPVKVGSTAKVVAEDPSDDKFLACAVSGKADVLVSGDGHLLKLKAYRRIPIVDLRTFLDQRA